MGHRKKRAYAVIILPIFILYFFAAARPIPRETILAPGWISSSEAPVFADGGISTREILPFTLGSRFGYVDTSGQFIMSSVISDNIYLGSTMWTEYPAEPLNIEIKNISGETITNIEDTRGYPVLLDNRVFILGSEQNSLSEIGIDGNILWTYEFGAPLTCIDAAAGFVLTGSLDGVIEILDSNGNRVFYFQPSGSQYEIIYGCAISSNGSRFAIVSGLDPQRFLLFERFGNGGSDYRVVYHEFLEGGFRRPVHISFIDEDRRVVFERDRGIGCYNIRSRRSMYIPLDGNVAAIDYSGAQGLLFLITSQSLQRKELVGIRIPQDRRFLFFGLADAQNVIFLKAPFKSEDVFLARTGSMLIAGGGKTLISFALEEK
ncbi:MAG: WD40 repeat domain-containing protein [Treponema sp.]|jgi:hypothetical protein|nr:WD40 repeat domain-containing protein [Treponema sp.]